MARRADRVLGEARKLSPDERARIAAELLATLDLTYRVSAAARRSGFGRLSGGPGLP